MKRLYEAMFVIDSAKAKEDYAKMEGECLNSLTRHGAEVVKSVKWDDRRLCFEINKIRRGTFILVHFESEPENIGKMERQCQLNENILRVLITVDEDGIDAETGSRDRSENETPAEISE